MTTRANCLLSDTGWNERENSKRKAELDAAGVPYSFQDPDELERLEEERCSRIFATSEDLEFEKHDRLMRSAPGGVALSVDKHGHVFAATSGRGARAKGARKRGSDVCQWCSSADGEPVDYFIQPIVPENTNAKEVRTKLIKLARSSSKAVIELRDLLAAKKLEMNAGRARGGRRGAPKYYGDSGTQISLRIGRSVVEKLRPAMNDVDASWTHAVALALAS